MLSKNDVKLNSKDRKTKLIRRVTTYILKVVESYSDTLPAIPSENQVLRFGKFLIVLLKIAGQIISTTVKFIKF